MFTTQINRQIENAEIVRQRGRGGKYRKIYTTQNNRQIERESLQHRTIDKQIDSQIERKGRQVQTDVYKIKQQIDREIVRQRGGGDKYRQMYTTQNNRQIERQLDREEGEVGTERCTQQSTIDKWRESLQHRTIDRQRDSKIERKGRQEQIDVHNIEQQIDRQIERQLDRQEEEVGTDR